MCTLSAGSRARRVAAAALTSLVLAAFAAAVPAAAPSGADHGALGARQTHV
jgi:hypothetical protein